jgi:hypothetical protein
MYLSIPLFSQTQTDVTVDLKAFTHPADLAAVTLVSVRWRKVGMSKFLILKGTLTREILPLVFFIRARLLTP